MRKLAIFLALAFFGAGGIGSEEPVTKIFFGSCIKQEKPIPILETIASKKPDVFIFLGDNIYGDTEDMDVMRAKYAMLKANPGFAKLTNSSRIMATWDDHDYGVNDGGASYPKRAEAQKLFVDFWNDPEDSPRRKRAGVYDSQIFGPEGKRVQVILLDTRYFRGALKTGERRTGGKYYPEDNPEIPMLGEAQWKWLEAELQKPAEIRIIGSGIQIVPEAAGQETWSNLPHERQRLFDVIAKTKAEGVFFISGDRHWSEYSKQTDRVPYPLFDFTSSSLNQLHPRGTPTVNQYRVSKTTYHKENFGEILIDWAGAETTITVKISDLNGEEKISEVVPLKALK